MRCSPGAPLFDVSRHTFSSVMPLDFALCNRRPVLIVVPFVVFSPVMTHDFTLYDDTSYVIDDGMVRAGLTWRGVVWAFTTTFTGDWHPHNRQARIFLERLVAG